MTCIARADLGKLDMHTVKRIDVEGFWGTRPVSVEFDKNVNFLIGKNGSGKTTLINMMASALRLDFDALERLAFKKIALQLQDSESRSVAELQIERKSAAIPISGSLLVRFRAKRSDSWLEEDFSEYLEF